MPLDRTRTSTWEAPYQHRNVVGAVLAFAPRLPGATTDAVLQYSFCGGDASLSKALNAGASAEEQSRPRGAPVRVRVTSRPIGGALGAERTMSVECFFKEIAR